MSRRSLAIASLGAVVVLFAACGNPVGKSSSGTPATPAAGFLTAANDAAGVVLVGMLDLPPGWSATPHDAHSTLAGFTGDCAVLENDDPVSGSVASKVSDDFSGPGHQLTTYADVFSDAAAAGASLGALGAVMDSCKDQFGSAIENRFRTDPRYADVNVSVGDLPDLGFGDETHAWHITIDQTSVGAPAPGTLDVILVRSGAIVLTVVGSSDNGDGSLILGVARTLTDRAALANVALSQAVVPATPVPTLEDAGFQTAANSAAAAIMLRLADLPAGWSVDNSEHNGSDFQFLGECAPLNSGAIVPGAGVSRSSDAFAGDPGTYAALEVDVYKTASDAKAQFDGRTWLMSHCGQQLVKMLRTDLYRDLDSSSGYATFTFSEIAAPNLGDDARAFNTPLTFTVQSRSVVVDFDWIFIRRGAIVTVLTASPGFDGGSLPMDLAHTIADRMTLANTTLPQ